MPYKTFCIFKHGINPYKESSNIIPGVSVNIKIPKYKEYFILLAGDVYNIGEIKKQFSIASDVVEEVILELYFKVGVKTPNYLKGIFTVLIVSVDKIIIFRDYFSISSIYYFTDMFNNEFVITNKISEIKKFVNLKVNTQVLPRYFLRTSLHVGDTFFENVKTLEFAQLVEISLDNSKITPVLYDDSFFKRSHNDQLKDDIIINKTEDIIFKNLKEIVNYYSGNTVVNSLSGGVDSSYLQVLLKKLKFDKAFTYSHEMIGTKLRKYSTDISKYLKIEHKEYKLKSDQILDNIKKGVSVCEAPYIFEGEFLEHYMYATISKTEDTDILITHGQGSDAIFGYGRSFFELKYLANPLFRLFFKLVNESFIRFYNKNYYNKYKIVMLKIKKQTIDEELLYLLFDSKYNGEVVKKAFKLDDLYDIYSSDIKKIRRFETDFLDTLHRSRYDFDFPRASFVTYNLCNQYGLKVCFPYINKELLLYMCSVPLVKKIRRLTDKYFIKKILLRHLPSEFVYRKKIMGATENFLYFFSDERINKIIQDIKNTKFSYFDFDYESIFTDMKYYGIAIKIINFYIWHKIFIEEKNFNDI
jgi:asparagine synthetase B (glutamine-hydrolysing)